MRIHEDVAALYGTVRRIRRDLHRIPEVGYHERKTQAYIIDYLERYVRPDRLEVIADTGVKAVLYTPGADRTTAFRTDIDALCIAEQNDVEYKSQHPGYMHACGHDGHAAVLLTFAAFLANNRDKLKENVVLLFQPAEEQIGGAKRIVEEGGLLDPKVDRIFGLHVWPEIPAGNIGVREGPMMAQTCEFDITVHGKSAHGARPHLGIDAIVAAAEIIDALQTIVTRSIDPYEKVLLTIGRIEGGQARNIIADKVVMNGTVRTFKDDVHSSFKERIREILSGMEKVCRVKCEFDEVMHYPVLKNPRELCDLLLYLTEAEGVVMVDEIMTAEDFAFYQQYVPGLFFLLGVGSAEHREPLHSSTFDFDERALLTGVEVYRRLMGIE